MAATRLTDDDMTGRVEILPDSAAIARHAAEWITSAALEAKGAFRVSLSGGSTPKTLYGLLASDEFKGRFPWHRVSWYWGDERFVPYDSPESNYRLALAVLLFPIGLFSFRRLASNDGADQQKSYLACEPLS